MLSEREIELSSALMHFIQLENKEDSQDNSYRLLLITNYHYIVNTNIKLWRTIVRDQQISDIVKEELSIDKDITFRIFYINTKTIMQINKSLVNTGEQYGGHLDIGDESSNKTSSKNKVILIGVETKNISNINAFNKPHFTTTINKQTYHIL